MKMCVYHSQLWLHVVCEISIQTCWYCESVQNFTVQSNFQSFSCFLNLFSKLSSSFWLITKQSLYINSLKDRWAVSYHWLKREEWLRSSVKLHFQKSEKCVENMNWIEKKILIIFVQHIKHLSLLCCSEIFWLVMNVKEVSTDIISETLYIR